MKTTAAEIVDQLDVELLAEQRGRLSDLLFEQIKKGNTEGVEALEGVLNFLEELGIALDDE